MNTTPPVTPKLEGAEITEAIVSRPTNRIRAKLAEFRSFLIRIEELTHGLPGTRPEDQRKLMQQIATIYRNEILYHSDWEERRLYPAVDKRASKGSEPFTSTIRYEHRIISRWIAELEIETRLRYPDERHFTQLNYQLLGLLKSHFEQEELVLLPVLDKTMSVQQFNDEIYNSLEEIKAQHF